MRVSHDEVAGTARVENIEGDDSSPQFSAVTFPLACYDKLCKAILESLHSDRYLMTTELDRLVPVNKSSWNWFYEQLK